MFNFENLKSSWVIFQGKKFKMWQVLLGLVLGNFEIHCSIWFLLINLLMIVFHLVQEKEGKKQEMYFTVYSDLGAQVLWKIN